MPLDLNQILSAVAASSRRRNAGAGRSTDPLGLDYPSLTGWDAAAGATRYNAPAPRRVCCGLIFGADGRTSRKCNSTDFDDQNTCNSCGTVQPGPLISNDQEWRTFADDDGKGEEKARADNAKTELGLDANEALGISKMITEKNLTEAQKWKLLRFNQAGALLRLLCTDREMISADECREAQGRVGNALRAMTDEQAIGTPGRVPKHRGSAALWAIALALDAVAKRTSEGFVVGANAESFDWDVIFAWLKARAKGMPYFMQDDGGSVNAVVSGKSSRTYRLDSLGPPGKRENKAKVLSLLLKKAARAGGASDEEAAERGLDAAVVAGERPKVRDDPLAALYGGGGGGGGPSGDCATINRL